MKAVNLLPSDNRGGGAAAQPAKAPPTGGSATGAYAVIGALALAVVMAVAYVLVDNSVKDRRAELQTVKSELASVRLQAAALKPYAEFKQMAEQRVSTVKQIARSRFDWERSLRDISRAIPGDIRLRSLKGTVSNTAGGGLPLRTGVAAPAIELAGCTKTSQSSVARLMSRLRAVRGVTRVSLQKSEKPEQEVTAASADQKPLCGPGDPPAFEVVMFFERKATGLAPAAPVGQAAVPAAGQQAPPTGSQPAQSGQAAATPTPASGSTSQGVSNP